MGYIWFGAVAWAVVVGLIAANTHGSGALGYMLLAIAPLGALLFYFFSRAGSRDNAHAAMLAHAGVAQGMGFDHSEAGTGIAINKEAMTVTMLADGACKTYPYGDIREWRSAKHTAGRMVGVGLAHGIQAARENSRSQREASSATGFFVGVRDVDYPVWRISMQNEAAQNRWMEIFRQEINES